MNPLKRLLTEYTKTALEIEEKKDRLGITTLEKSLEETKNQIKDTARSLTDKQVGEAATDLFMIRVDRPYRKFYDIAAVKKYATKAELQVVEGAIVTEIDPSKFEELVKGGLISRTLRQKAFREEAQTPRVSIVPIKN